MKTRSKSFTQVEPRFFEVSQDPLMVLPSLENLPMNRWFLEIGGSEGIRTPDLVSAIHALSQLSYGPT